MPNAISEYLSRFLMMLLFLSPVVIALTCGRYYKAKTAEIMAQRFSDTVSTGYIDLSEYESYANEVGKLGYAMTISITRMTDDVVPREEHVTLDDIYSGAADVNGIRKYKLRNKDFVRVIVRTGDSFLQSTAVFFGEEERGDIE